MSRLIIFPLIVLLASCAGNVVVMPLHCPNQHFWNTSVAKSENIQKFSAKKRFKLAKRSPSVNLINIKDVLQESNVRCENIRSMSISIQQDFQDVINLAFLFNPTKTVLISGTVVEEEVDDVEEDVFDFEKEGYEVID